MINFEDLIKDILKNIDIKVTTKITSKLRTMKNCISPSLLTLEPPSKRHPDNVFKQVNYLFKPEDLLSIGRVEEPEYYRLKNRNVMDAAGHLNCAIGTFVHEMLLYEMERVLRKDKIETLVEIPVFSREYCIDGTADMIIFDNKKIHLFDMKTTGNKILERDDMIEKSHMKQLYCYALALQEMYEDHEIGSINVLSVCKTPNSYFNGNKLPITALASTTMSKLSKYKTYLSGLSKEVIQLNGECKKNIKDYNHWTLNNDEYPYRFLERMENIDKRITGYNKNTEEKF